MSHALSGVNLRRVTPEMGASCALSDTITSVTEYLFPVSISFVLVSLCVVDHPPDAAMQAFNNWQIPEFSDDFERKLATRLSVCIELALAFWDLSQLLLGPCLFSDMRV